MGIETGIIFGEVGRMDRAAKHVAETICEQIVNHPYTRLTTKTIYPENSVTIDQVDREFTVEEIEQNSRVTFTILNMQFPVEISEACKAFAKLDKLTDKKAKILDNKKRALRAASEEIRHEYPWLSDTMIDEVMEKCMRWVEDHDYALTADAKEFFYNKYREFYA